MDTQQFVPSPYQAKIFNFIQNGHGNAIVEAVAGSGKTTTLIEALNFAKGSHIFLAFNKKIATELQSRGVNARTFHSLTYGVVTNSRGIKNVDGDKMKKLAKELFVDSVQRKMYMNFCVKLVGLAKNAGLGCVVEPTERAFLELMDHHDLTLESESASLHAAVTYSMRLLQISNDSKQLLDFDDLLYFAVKDRLNLRRFDFVFVDEAQDTNVLQREILKKIMHPGSRLVAVGDRAQAIYGFRGAGSNSMDLVGDQFHCERLPLTVSYRCPKAVVQFVNENWVSHIESAPNAIEGKVEDLDQWSPSVFGAGDLVVSRTTKPLIKLGYEMMKAKKPFYILGRDLGQGLKTLIRMFEPKSIKDLEDKTHAWQGREVAKAMRNEDEAKAEAIKDKADCVLFLCSALVDQSLFALETSIDEMFSEKAKATMLATIHKAKGLEADNVFWLNSSQCPSKWAKQDWQKQQEVNLCYVAATRAKKNLFLIEDEQESFQ